MSIESFQAFQNRMKTDDDFRDRVIGSKNKEERHQIITEAGYFFTYDDMAYAKQWVRYFWIEDEHEYKPSSPFLPISPGKDKTKSHKDINEIDLPVIEILKKYKLQD